VPSSKKSRDLGTCDVEDPIGKDSEGSYESTPIRKETKGKKLGGKGKASKTVRGRIMVLIKGGQAAAGEGVRKGVGILGSWTKRGKNKNENREERDDRCERARLGRKGGNSNRGRIGGRKECKGAESSARG